MSSTAYRSTRTIATVHSLTSIIFFYLQLYHCLIYPNQISPWFFLDLRCSLPHFSWLVNQVYKLLTILQLMVIWADIFITPIIHAEAARYRAELFESKPLIQVSCMHITCDNRIEL